jgi:ABC-type branched-subunit amino acid transport system substrate-binding protein
MAFKSRCRPGRCIIGACVATVMFVAKSAFADDIVVGHVLPFTGPVATSAAEYAAGAQAYFSLVNEAGGVNGRKIRVVTKDDGFKPERTVAQTRDLIAQENPLAMLGALGTPQLIALGKSGVLTEARIAMVGPITGAAEVRTSADTQLFHLRASFTEEATKLVEHLNSIGLRRIAVMYENSSLGAGPLAAIEAQLSRLNLKLVAKGSYERARPDDADAAVAAIGPSGADAVIMIGITRGCATFIRKLRERGVTPRLYGLSIINIPDLIGLAGPDEVRGVGVTQEFPYPFGSTTPIAREFRVAMSRFAPGKGISYGTMESFVSAKVLVEALRRAGANPTRERVGSALEALQGFDVGGMQVTFGRGNRTGSRFVDIVVIGQKGQVMR